MPKRRRGNKLQEWEVALIRAMIGRGDRNDQDILAYFTRPTRSINHARISDIRTERTFKEIKAASDAELENFLVAWPNVDTETGLDLRGDELLVKAREAMIAAVHVFNSAGLTFRAELFIVSTIVAWTYLLHAWFRTIGVDFRYRGGNGEIRKTKEGAERYWDLSKCLRYNKSPISIGARKNLEFLIELRHEIEHRSTSRIDDTVSAKLQACCINFNDAIKSLFGVQYGLERRLPIALQFVTFDADQRNILKKAVELPPNVKSLIDAFEHNLTEEEYADPAYQYRVAFVPLIRNRASGSDVAIEFVQPDSEEGQEINKVLVKPVERNRYTASQVCEKMQLEGFLHFNQHAHTLLWKRLGAKDQAKGFGRPGDYKNTWVWYDSWIARVRAHCEEQEDRYK